MRPVFDTIYMVGVIFFCNSHSIYSISIYFANKLITAHNHIRHVQAAIQFLFQWFLNVLWDNAIFAHIDLVTQLLKLKLLKILDNPQEMRQNMPGQFALIGVLVDKKHSKHPNECKNINYLLII